MKDDQSFLEKLVSETLQQMTKTVSLSDAHKVGFLLKNISCYRVDFNGKALDFPMNWSFFADLRPGSWRLIEAEDDPEHFLSLISSLTGRVNWPHGLICLDREMKLYLWLFSKEEEQRLGQKMEELERDFGPSLTINYRAA